MSTARRRPRAPTLLDDVIVEGTAEKLVPGGLALLHDDAGALFARGALPGERVRVQVRRKKGGARHGVVLDVLEPSPLRARPDCVHHPRCGGCDLLDVSPAAQGSLKRAIVLDALARIGRLDEEELSRVEECRSPEDGRASRRRARFVVDAQGRLSFHGRESAELATIDRCLAVVEALEDARRRCSHASLPPGLEVRLAVDDRGRASAAVSERAAARALVDTRAVDGAVVVGDDDEVVGFVGDPILLGEVAPGAPGGPYASDAATFTQATRFGARAILDLVVEEARPAPGAGVLELFAGAGHLTLPLAAAGARVVAVEGARRSFHFLEENRARSRLSDRIEPRRAFIGPAGGPWLAGPHDVVVADPPRTGIPGFAALLARTTSDRLVLVSCDPATGARDIAAARAQGFALSRLVPIDAFPRTSHVEWVASLVRRSPATSP